MFLIYSTFGTLVFTDVFSRAVSFAVPEHIFVLIAFFLFIGATGKSAQIPLLVWLPDAMAGPTPVSALIHAATMVTAGVYMVARCSIIYASAPAAMMVVAVIGVFTAFFAVTIGLVQNDIKKVLAYSTVSQLGYMFLALGAGAFSAGIFHVMTHAFFKALLFLGAVVAESAEGKGKESFSEDLFLSMTGKEYSEVAGTQASKTLTLMLLPGRWNLSVSVTDLLGSRSGVAHATIVAEP